MNPKLLCKVGSAATILAAILIFIVSRGGSEITFEAVAEGTEMRVRLHELFIASKDAFSAVVRDGAFEWQDADGKHTVAVGRARLVCDASNLNLKVRFDDRLSPMRMAAISQALQAAADQRYIARVSREIEERGKVLRARLVSLEEELKNEKDMTKKRILAEQMGREFSIKIVCEPDPNRKFFGLRIKG